MAQLRRGESRQEKHLDQFTYVYFTRLVLSTGDIAQLVERRPCKRVVALTGWVPNCLGGNGWWYLPSELVANSDPKNAVGGPKHAAERLYQDREKLLCRAG